jgi:hypothetical protein
LYTNCIEISRNCTTTESYDESNQALERILSLSISKLALETGVLEDAIDVQAFYEQKAVPSARELAQRRSVWVGPSGPKNRPVQSGFCAKNWVFFIAAVLLCRPERL